MNPARSPHRIRTISALITVAGAVTVSLAGCSSSSGVDGTYVSLYNHTAGGTIRSAWIIKGDSIQRVDGSCESYSLDDEPDTLSEDRTRIIYRDSGDTSDVEWYEDESGFVQNDHEYVRADSEVAQPFIERWEAKCGMEWQG